MRTPLLFALIAVASACASQPKPVATCPPVSAPSPAPAAPTPPARPAQPSLLDYVPANAVAAAIIRRNAFEELIAYLAARPEMQAELSRLLVERVGVDLSAIDGFVLSASSLDGKSFGLFAHLDHKGPVQLKEPEAGRYADVPLVKLNRDLWAAAVPGGVVMGLENDVKAAIDVARTKRVAGPQSVLPLLANLRGDYVVAARVVTTGEQNVDAAAQQFGLQSVTASFDADRLLTVRVEGDAQRLPALLEVIRMGKAFALTAASQYKAEALAGKKVVEAATAVVAEYETRRLLAEIEPRLEGNALVSRYRVPASTTGVYLAGAAAAIAVPAFTRYTERARGAEARTHLRAITTLLQACEDKCQARLTSTPWTPAASCCGQPDNRCASSEADWSHPTWKALGFSPNGPLAFRYRIVKTGKGRKAAFNVEAQADLKCNGALTELSQSARIDSHGSWIVDPIQPLD
jgi:hypothetical protein